MKFNNIIIKVDTLAICKLQIAGFFLCLFLASCAIRQQPTGGDKDLAAPQIEKIIPENYSTGFNTNEIKIEFNEYIDLKDLSKQLVISPLMINDPEINVKGRLLIIKLPDSLKQNTTYTLNFGNSIVDTHEGNALEDFQYVFSTGPVLDSLQVKGSVKFARDLKIEKGIVLMLYNNLQDTIVYNSLPDYFAKTDSAGNFVVKNLRPGTYKLFALKDGNSNYKFDSKAEAIGFLNESIQVPDTAWHHLRLFFEPDTLPHVLKAQYVSQSKAIIVFTAPVKDFQLRILLPNIIDASDLLFEKSSNNDSIYVYCTDTLADSLNAVVYNGSFVVDTIYVNLKSKNASRGRGSGIATGLTVNTNLRGDVLEFPDDLMLTFSAPLKAMETSRIRLNRDSISNVSFTIEPVDSLKKTYRIRFKPEENKSYSLIIPSDALSDIFNQDNDSLIIKFRTREEREYANVILNFTTSITGFSYIVQLLTENDMVVKETTVAKNTKITFGYVVPGKYKIRVIDDANKNYHWDSGSYWNKVQPENVFYYPDLVTARANWDVDINWFLK